MSDNEIAKSASSRLSQALTLLGYEKVNEAHFRSNLVQSIRDYAGLQGDEELKAACEQEIERISNDTKAGQGWHENIRGPEYYKKFLEQGS